MNSLDDSGKKSGRKSSAILLSPTNDRYMASPRLQVQKQLPFSLSRKIESMKRTTPHSTSGFSNGKFSFQSSKSPVSHGSGFISKDTLSKSGNSTNDITMKVNDDDMSSVGSKDLQDDEEIDENNIETRQYIESLQQYEEFYSKQSTLDNSEELSRIVVDGLTCPAEFVNVLAPMEFEEIVAMFRKYDTDGSNTIDKHEIRKILLHLGLDSSIERSEELLELLDKENAGEIGFNAFCRFIVLIKQGDSRLRHYRELLTKLQETPLGQLEHQAKLRNLKVRFLLKQQISGVFENSNNKSTYVEELHLSGIWQESVDGKLVEVFQVKVFQGVGKTSREAKYNAATTALIKLGDTMPGINFKVGVFPEEWLDWIDKNLGRGVDPITITSLLVSKGFHPHRNPSLMQKIITWQSFDRFQSANEDLDIFSTASLDPRLKQWIIDSLNHGIDGEVILNVLSDRSFDLMTTFPHFAQKVRNNELGTLTDAGGKEPTLLDFYVACEKGFLDEVRLYCNCGMPVNEEQMSRASSEPQRPLSLASQGGHAHVVKVLLSYNADVNAIDKRGRSALHLAAWKGHISVCELLIDAGARVFQGDHQGNTPLHLAALSNKFETLKFLAQKSQDLTRYISSDKIRVSDGITFNQIVDKLFELMPKIKLKENEAQRFEKLWLRDTALKLIEMCDKEVQFMLPDVTEEIMMDALERFDPRPETGILVLTTSNSNQSSFIPTITGPEELSILLKRAFHLASIDPLNGMKRTPLHLACDANHIDSHAKIIDLLVEKYGCNLLLKDKQKRTPLDLLTLERHVLNAPTATKLREDVYTEKREGVLDAYSKDLLSEERRMTEARREQVMNECIRRAEELSDRLWDTVRIGSILKSRCLDWEIFEDPDTLNNFYCRRINDPVKGIIFDEYSWWPSQELKYLLDRRIGLQYQRLIRSTLLRKFAQWEMLQCSTTKMIFYYDPIKDFLSYKTPKEASFVTLVKQSRVIDTLGYSNEWEELVDSYNNKFYRQTFKKECQWDQPLEAVRVTDVERFCTAFQCRDKAIVQKWYTCDQCNREWSCTPEGTKTLLKLCLPCVNRCHRAHKGVRQVRHSGAICNCLAVGDVASYQCQACTISPQQLATQSHGEVIRKEKCRRDRHDSLIPPVFAMVPPYYPDGRKKVLSGWLLCRRVPTKSLDELFYSDISSTESNSNPTDQDFESVESSPSKARTSNKPKAFVKGGDISSDSDVDDESSIQSKNANSLKLSKNPSSSISVTSGEGRRTNLTGLSSILASMKDKAFDFTYKCVDGLPSDWVQVYDPEESDDLPIGSKVLVAQQGGIMHVYGTIISQTRQGFFSVELNDKSVSTYFRTSLELLSKRIFYFNTSTGSSAWTVDEALTNPYQTKPLSLPGIEWINFFEKSSLRREFGKYDEMFNPVLDFIYYVDVEQFKKESSARRIQNLYRKIYHRSLPNSPWLSEAFTITPPTEVVENCRLRAGWAYLRRRSKTQGEFRDINGSEWEECVDKKSAEYFYYMEDSNKYQFDKPIVPDRNKKMLDLYKIGDNVLYRFPKKHHEEIAIISNIRYDDETGEDMYDLYLKSQPESVAKWVPHIKIKRPPLEGDALTLQRHENAWVRQIRRNREAIIRRKKRAKEAIIAAEMERLRFIKIMQGIITQESSSDSDGVNIMRGRVSRIECEQQDEKDEIDRTEGAARRELVKARVEQIKSESAIPLSRADILSISRAVDMQVRMTERMQKQHTQQKQVENRKRLIKSRFEGMMETLVESESRMSTPRSSARREVIRRVHAAQRRQEDKMIICEWGCGDWVRMGYDRTDHHDNRCRKRIIQCSLGCDVKMTEEEWLSKYNPKTLEDMEDEAVNKRHTDIEIDHIFEEEICSVIDSSGTVQHHHEINECVKRLVYCPRQCLEWIPYESLQLHLDEKCSRRPAKPIYCRLGCGVMFGGMVEKLIQAEDERLLHETEECEFRMVRCNWKYEDGKFCAAQMMAKDRDQHRDYHLSLLGINTYLIPGTYLYKVPSKVTRLKVQVWGAGGGSGYFKDRKGGNGGGGAFVEVMLNVEPFEVLEIVVGSGGGAGVSGTEIEIVDLDTQRENIAKHWRNQMNQDKQKDKIKDKNRKANFLGDSDVIDEKCGVTTGGSPGGGDGYGGGLFWASGGGGGYSIVSKRTPQGNQALIVAAGGGGGSSNDGLPGTGMDGPLPGTKIDIINGESASCEGPGKAGWSGTALNSRWPATSGEQWSGGMGSEFGAGGGGGYFGGGGGGTTPGIGGAGGGGSSYVYLPRAYDHVIISGHNMKPGGLNHNPPEAVGVGEWDKVGGLVGQGGEGNYNTTHPGNNGAVRIFKPGHF